MILPKGYKLLECIESTGTQYIDTGFCPTNTSRIATEISGWSTSETSTAIWGSQSSGVRYDFFVTAGGIYRSYYGVEVSDLTSTSIDGKVVADRNGTAISLGSYSAITPANTFAGAQPLYLFAHNNKGAVEKQSSVRMFSCQIYDNGTLIRQFAPCIDPNGAVGLYDVVEGKFYGNAGTGTFVAGDELLEVEYIESSGTQYITTGLVNTTGYVVETKMNFTSLGSSASSNSAYICGSYNGSARSYVMLYNSKFGIGVSTDTFASDTVIIGTDYIIKASVLSGDGYLIVGGVQKATNNSAYDLSANNLDFRLFTIDSTTAHYARMCSAKMYYFKIYDSAGMLVRNYIPMVTGGGIAGLYDLVNNTFSVDAAGGNFLAGPIIEESGPSAPEHFRTLDVTESTVTLGWDAVDAATGYKLYRNLALIAEQTETEYTDTGLRQFTSYQYDVVAYNKEAQSAPATLVVSTALADLGLALVTDRTAEDVSRVKSLAQKWMGGTITADEKAEFLSFSMKGAYNFTDLNRVESAVRFVSEYIDSLQGELDSLRAEYGVAEDAFWVLAIQALSLSTKENRTVSDLPTVNELERYLSNVDALTERIPVEKNLPASAAYGLDYAGANEIERSVLAEYDAAQELINRMSGLVRNTAAGYVQSGEIFGGEF